MITVDELSAIAVLPRRQKASYVNKLRKFWCNRMQASERCYMPCSTSPCAQHLKNIVSGIRIGEVRNVDAVLTWCIRNEIANLEEAGEEQKIIFDSLLGTPVKQNAFSVILSEIGEK